MKLRVSHLTRYQYDREVSFSPHLLYLRPRESALHRLRSYRLNVSPSAQLFVGRDAHDNAQTWAHFWDRADALNFRTEFEVETLEENPFDFILAPAATAFPFAYEPAIAATLGACLAPPPADAQAELRSWLDAHSARRPAETIALLSQLCLAVYQSIDYERRETGAVQPALVTLGRGAGACRDFAVLFIELCRMLGLAARFVSGYLYAPPDDDHRTAGAMHAWVEVYLPGAGWKGLDPTHGLWCNDAFIPVAHAAQAESVNPVQGSYYNETPVESRLHTDIVVEAL